jgi:phosphatidylglycerophosphate synthase
MSKLAPIDKFLDLSDYGRPFAKQIANALKDTKITPIHVTLLFGLCGLISIYLMLQGMYFLAGLFLILKSILDAADGELSRIKKTPSHTGRYLDSIFDIILNFLILMTIANITDTSGWMTAIAFLCIQLQGTLYNYYYVILRNKRKGGDVTSRIFEHKSPRAMTGENQTTVNILFQIFYFLYSIFDKTIYLLDPEATKVRTLPRWFMSMVSIYGLGFQLLLIAVLMTIGYIDLVIPFFICYSVLLILFIELRKKVLTEV